MQPAQVLSAIAAGLLVVLSAYRADAAAGGRYVAVSIAEDFSVMMVDTASISNRTAWIINVSPIPDYDEGDKFYYSYTYTRTQFDCAGRKTRTLAMEQKDANEKSLWSRDNLTWDWNYVKPDSLVEPALELVCNGKTFDPKNYWDSPAELFKQLVEKAHERK